MVQIDPFGSFAQGVSLRNNMNQQRANVQAAQGLASGNYAQALGALGGVGDIANVLKVQEAQVNNQKAARETQAADTARQIAFTRQAARSVRSALKEGQDPLATFDSLAPALQSMGSTPEQISAFRQSLAQNPTGFLDQVDAIASNAQRQLEIQNLGNGYGVAIDKTTGQVVNEYRAPRDPVNVNGVWLDPETREVIFDTRAPTIERVNNTDGSTSVIAIDQPAPIRGSGGGSGVPRGIRNNNPGNIEDGPFAQSLPGYRGSDGRFAIFDSPQAGINAGGELLNRYAARGVVTPAQIINRWAPPSDGNPTQAYAQYVAQRLGIGVNDPVPANRRAEAFQAINEFENGNRSASNGASAAASGGGARVVAQGANRGLSPSEQRAEARAQQSEQAASRRDEVNLRREFNNRQEVKDFRTVQSAYNSVQAAARNPSAAGDLSLIFAYMKILDPGSVVREQEFANAQNAAGVPDQIRNRYNQILNGQRLNQNQRRDFLNQANNLFQTRLQTYRGIENEYRGYAESYGVSPDRVAPLQGQQQGRPQTNAPGIPFNLAGPQLATRQRLIRGGATPSAPRGSQQNPRYINPENPQKERQSLMNILPGQWFVTPSGEMLRMPNPNPYRRR